MEISRTLADQIVDAVKEICSYDINFISTEGTIFASTDPARVGTYHEIGREAAVKHETIEVGHDDQYLGTRMGVNIPIDYDGECIAVIGISGDPEEVRKYAFLALRIALLLLKEQELDRKQQGRRQMIESFVRTVINAEQRNQRYFDDFSERFRIDTSLSYRMVIAKLKDRYNPANLSMIEASIYEVFDKTGSKLYAYRYPHEYLLIVSEKQWKNGKRFLKEYAANHHEILHIGVGLPGSLLHMHESFRTAQAAVRSCSADSPFQIFDELDIELILSQIPENTKKRYLARTAGQLTNEQINLLHVYFSNSMSLARTSEALFIHKNTVQYQLNHIHGITGYNPRVFKDAVVLYLAIMIKKA